MIVDKQEHKEMLLALIEASTFNGRMVAQVYELKKAVEEAQIPESPKNA